MVFASPWVMRLRREALHVPSSRLLLDTITGRVRELVADVLRAKRALAVLNCIGMGLSLGW